MGIIARITMGVVTLSDTLSQRHLDRFPELRGKKGDGIYVYRQGVTAFKVKRF